MCGAHPHGIMAACTSPHPGLVIKPIISGATHGSCHPRRARARPGCRTGAQQHPGRSILALDSSHLRYFHDHAEYFRVAEIDGQLAGFVIALREGGDYESTNYRWFAAHYPQFVYIDRIVIANAYRRHGLGRIFYSDVNSYAEVRVPLMTCEVFLEPRDDVVVLFHGTYGFQEVGQQRMGEDGPQVSLLAKDLPSYTYVRETWLDHGGLPDVPWLAESPRLTNNTDLQQNSISGEPQS